MSSDIEILKEFLQIKAEIMKMQVSMRFKKDVTKQMFEDYSKIFERLKEVYNAASSVRNPWAQNEILKSGDTIKLIEEGLKNFPKEFILNEKGIYVRRDSLEQI